MRLTDFLKFKSVVERSKWHILSLRFETFVLNRYVQFWQALDSRSIGNQDFAKWNSMESTESIEFVRNNF